MTTAAEQWHTKLAELAAVDVDRAIDVRWRYRRAWPETDKTTGWWVVPFDRLSVGEQTAWLRHVDGELDAARVSSEHHGRHSTQAEGA